MRKAKQLADDVCEDYCFLCKDGGEIRGCDYKYCLKAYHPECIGKENSFLESNEKWDCSWHTCFICKNSALYQCYCCPNSVCETCIKEAEFVPLKKKQNNNKGFCNNCLRLAILIEENIDVDSDGGKVDFKDTETFEYLFKEYWEIVKENEGLSLQDLKAAKKYLKKGKLNINPSDSAETETISEDYIPESSDSFHPSLESRKRKSDSIKDPNTKQLLYKKGPKKRNFLGWGSEELINFLSSIGKYTSKEISQSDACGIIEEYIERNNLYHPLKKRKMIISDGNLRGLFGKGKFKAAKIYKMLESHFPGNENDEGWIVYSEDEKEEDYEREIGNYVKKKRKNQEQATVQQVSHIREQYSEAKRKCRAKLVRENMDIIFLRRSVILHLLKEDPNTFEEKVKGCFVRVKHDPKDFYVKPRNLYQVARVTGVIKGREEYKVGDVATNILLEVSNKDMKLLSVMEESFDEMDLDDLKELARKGIFKMPTVGEIEDKLKAVHEFIMRNWIKRELVKLPKLITVASLKCRLDEKYEYIERKKLLEKPKEQERRIREMPVIIADPQEEEKIKIEEEQDNKKGKTVISHDSPTPVQNTGNDSAFIMNSPEEIKVDVSNPISTIEAKSMQIEEFQIRNLNTPEQTQILSSKTIKFKDLKPSNASPEIIELSDSDDEQNDENTPKQQSNEEQNDKSTPSEQLPATQQNDENTLTEQQPPEIRNAENTPPEQQPSEVKNDENAPTMQQPPEVQNDENTPTEKQPQIGNKGSEREFVWCYIDQQGKQQGPFSVEMFRNWKKNNYFEDGFKVWHFRQSSKHSVLLLDVLGISR